MVLWNSLHACKLLCYGHLVHIKDFTVFLPTMNPNGKKPQKHIFFMHDISGKIMFAVMCFFFFFSKHRFSVSLFSDVFFVCGCPMLYQQRIH